VLELDYAGDGDKPQRQGKNTHRRLGSPLGVCAGCSDRPRSVSRAAAEAAARTGAPWPCPRPTHCDA
jgi:hypothetical protein